jgi:hypothetical protein
MCLALQPLSPVAPLPGIPPLLSYLVNNMLLSLQQDSCCLHNSGQAMRVEVPYLMYVFLLESLLPPGPLSEENPHTCLMTHVSAAAQYLLTRYL